MASAVAMMIGGAVVNALAFSGSNYLFSHMGKSNDADAERERHEKKKVREKSRECHNHKPQSFPDSKRKRKPTNLNKHKPNKRTKSTKISSLFPKRGNRNTKRTEEHKNKMTHDKTYNKSPRRINHKAIKSKTNTGTTALERSVEQTTGGSKVPPQPANPTPGHDTTPNTEIHKNSVRIKTPNSVNASSMKSALSVASTSFFPTTML